MPPTSDRIRVRLVPKSESGTSLKELDAQVTPKMAKAFAPGLSYATSALSQANALGIDSKVTPKNSLDGLVTHDKFAELFGTKLKSYTRKKSEFSENATGTDEFLIPERELEVPADLKETIAFAYVPTPPQFFAPTLIPPSASHYHLRIADIISALRAGHCHRRGWSGRGIRMAMADSGFSRHPYFDAEGYNIHRIATPTTSQPFIDKTGHGTGESANVLAIAPDCTFYGIKHDDYSVEALETSLAQSPHILTNSWGWNIDNQSLDDLKTSNANLYNEVRDIEQTVADAIDDGVTVVFASGNGQLAFPASLPDVISVGGVAFLQDGQFRASNFASSYRSQYFNGRQVPDFCGVVGEGGAHPQKGHIMLPVPNGADLEGENLASHQSNKGWGLFSGTSAAAPQVAGIIALMLNVNGELTPAQIKTILADTSRDVESGQSANQDSAGPGHDHATGAGLVDAFAACLRVLQTP